MRKGLILLLLLVAAIIWQFGDLDLSSSGSRGDGLPAEAHETLALIGRGGPFPHRQDGSVFHNREGLLPARPTGYYREYTVRTPGARDRAARRIVTGGQPPEVYYYTQDHYRSFVRIEIDP
jgi:guanyl-specific ribonuclease Sa